MRGLSLAMSERLRLTTAFEELDEGGWIVASLIECRVQSVRVETGKSRV